jgi:TonB family protein
VAASVLVHALCFSNFGIPGTSMRSQGKAGPITAVHARLSPARSSSSATVWHAPPGPWTFSTGDEESRSRGAPDAHGMAATVAHTSGAHVTSHGGAHVLLLANTWHDASEVDVRAEPLEPVKLVYPVELDGTGISGHVRLRLFIDERGAVIRAEIDSSRPEHVFDRSAIQGWESVRFTPASKNGVAVKSQKLLELHFLP